MRWRRSTRLRVVDPRPDDPVVLTLTHPLTHETAEDVAAQVARLSPTAHVVIDLTAIPAFDTDGADVLLDLQESMGADRLSIVGFRQAAARLVGSEDTPPADRPPAGEGGWQVRRMRNLAVVQVREGVPADPHDLEEVLTAALGEEVGIVVLDLRPVPALGSEAVTAIAFASSTAALRGQEMLVVNVSAEVADRLRRAGMSATTYIAPEPILDDPY